MSAGYGDGLGGLVLVHECAHRVLGLVKQWLLDERFSSSRLG